MSSKEPLKSGDVVTTTTTTTTVERKQDLALCELWTSFAISILVTIGSIPALNYPMIGVGLLSAVGSGILIFVQGNNNGVRRVGFWILFAGLVTEAVALISLVTVGIILMLNPNFLGFGFFFGIILLITAVPVLIMTVIDLQSILKIRPQIFENTKITITESVTKMEEGGEAESPSEAKPAEESEEASEEVSASRSQKLPLLAMRK